MSMTDYANYDATGLAKLVAKGDVTAAELCEEAIARIEKHNPTLNAVICKMYDIAHDRATELDSRKDTSGERGPFHGVPFLLKDILGDHQGIPTTNGSKFTSGHPATQDSTLTARQKSSGLNPLGKTNTPEFGILPTTEPLLYGASRNPWNIDHSTGGSSGGSAAAVAAGIVPMAHTNDGGGSIRIPAACCGLFGLKPTRGRNPLGPVTGDLMSGLIVEHVVTRTVRDSALMLDCTHGPEAGDPYCAPAPVRRFIEEVGAEPKQLRIAFAKSAADGRELHSECRAAAESAAALCAELGHTVEEATPEIDPDSVSASFMTIWAAGLAFTIDSFAMIRDIEPKEESFEPLTWALYQNGVEISASQYQIAVAMLQMVSREIGRFHQNYDLWLTPTLGQPPIRNGIVDSSVEDAILGFAPMIDYVPFTPLANATGQPAMSIPLHWSDNGLPVGVMFTGRFGDEATLLRLAAQLEEARPWIERKPAFWD